MGKLATRQETRAGPASAPARRARRMLRPQRREQLLAAATGIVRISGIEALTMAALAEQAGVSKPVVYEHFSNSEEVGHFFPQLTSQVVSALDKASFIDTAIDFFCHVLN